VNARAGAKRGPVPPADESYEGPAVIESYTVFYKRDGSVRFGTIIAKNPAGARVLARVEPEAAAMIDVLTNGAQEPVGLAGSTQRGEDGLIHWNLA